MFAGETAVNLSDCHRHMFIRSEGYQTKLILQTNMVLRDKMGAETGDSCDALLYSVCYEMYKTWFAVNFLFMKVVF